MSKLPFLLLILTCGAVWGQMKGHIEGAVTGEDGEVLPGAGIAVRGPALPDGTGSISNEEGRFRIALPAGTYDVEITHVGYRTERAGSRAGAGRRDDPARLRSRGGGPLPGAGGGHRLAPAGEDPGRAGLGVRRRGPATCATSRP